jgi:hypothetical protein
MRVVIVNIHQVLDLCQGLLEINATCVITLGAPTSTRRMAAVLPTNGGGNSFTGHPCVHGTRHPSLLASITGLCHSLVTCVGGWGATFSCGSQPSPGLSHAGATEPGLVTPHCQAGALWPGPEEASPRAPNAVMTGCRGRSTIGGSDWEEMSPQLLPTCSICMQNYKSHNCRYYRCIFHYSQRCIFII